MELLAKSGPLGYVLLGISIITLSVFLERFIALTVEVMRLKKSQGIIQKIISTIEENRDLDMSRLEELVTITGEREVEGLSRGLGIIRLSYTISPLLGLLGTVLGMISAFKEVSLAGGAVNPQTLASGIWVALLTTAEGLTIAIVAFLMYHYLRFIVKKLARHISMDAEIRLMESKRGRDDTTRAKR